MGFNNYSKFGHKNNNPNAQEHKDNVQNESPSKIVKGKVINCDLLRIRKEPNLESEELIRISKGSELDIDSNYIESTDFYKVTTPDGINGYCMKEYISLV